MDGTAKEILVFWGYNGTFKGRFAKPKSISKRIFKFYFSNFNLLIDIVNKYIEKYNPFQKTYKIRIN